MKLYADLPVRRAVQIAGDVLLVVWLVGWACFGSAVHDATLRLAEPGHRVESASTSLSERLHDTGAEVAELPVVGSAARAPLDDAGDAAGQLADAGRAQVEAVEGLARWLGWSVALVPILVALLGYLPPRIRFVRRATAARGLVDSAADLDLFALRALTAQPLHRLAEISDDPARAWRDRDDRVVHQLAALELASAGLRPRR